MKRISSKIRFRRRGFVCRADRLLRRKRQLIDPVRPRFLHANWLVCAVVLQLGLSIVHAQNSSEPSLKSASAISKTTSNTVALVKSFRIIQEKDGPAVEILSSHSLSPSIQLIDNPPRLVIDLPNARLNNLDAKERRIEINTDQISSLRADQFQENPPVARLVVDLMTSRKYTFDSVGNRLVVHLGKNPADTRSSPFEQSVTTLDQSASPRLTLAPKPMIVAVRAAGPLAIADNTGDVGSSFTAGADTAVLRLSSGGELHVCPGTTVSITSSEDRHNLMLGMSAGAVETHITLDASSDLVMTPDFQVKLTGPGEFHYAFSTDNQGNTCVRTLPGNTAPAIVDEMLGDRTYQVKAADQLVFRGGRIDRTDMKVPLECGCPPPRQPMERASADLPVQNAAPRDAHLLSVNSLPETAISHAGTGTGVASTNTQSVPVAQENMYVQVSAPLVFNAADLPPAPVEAASALPSKKRSPSAEANLAATPLPPSSNTGTDAASSDPPPHRGFFHRIGHFVSTIFH